MKNICLILTLCIFLGLITAKSTEIPETVGGLNGNSASIKLDSPMPILFDEFEDIAPKSESLALELSPKS
jgi:hypothetical protein